MSAASLLAARALAGPFARSRIRFGALSAHREVSPMAHAAVRADLDEALDVERNLLAQVALHRSLGFNRLGDLAHFLFREILDPNVRINIHLGEDLARPMGADTINVLKTGLDPFGSREVYSCDASHSLPLPLLVFRVAANDADYALSLDDAALDADLLDRRSDLHFWRLRFIYLSPDPLALNASHDAPAG